MCSGNIKSKIDAAPAPEVQIPQYIPSPLKSQGVVTDAYRRITILSLINILAPSLNLM